MSTSTFDEFKLKIESRASLVSIICPHMKFHRNEAETSSSLKELEELVRTLGLTQAGTYLQKKSKIEAKAILGTGRLMEIAEEAKANNSDLLVFDFELTGSQLRNIKKITGLDAIDRCSVILEIFARHAHTKEAKMQIEIARLQYLLPRLTSYWGHFSKQKGGIGLKGEGEQQLELDRRMIRTRIERYKKQLGEMEISRKERGKRRDKKAVTAALVGYTNAGKSSLMNKLCKVDILAEDKLFATLDSTYRMLNPDTKPSMILIDTVGFLSNLPNTLIEGFKTTLESAIEADLLLLVVDVSDPEYQKQIEVTESVLSELGIDNKEKIVIFNKKDLLESPFEAKIKMRNYKDTFLISSYEKEDIDQLRSYIINHFLDQQDHYDLFIPYGAGEIHSIIRSQTNIMTEENHEEGIFYRVKTPDFIFNRLNLSKFTMVKEPPENEN